MKMIMMGIDSLLLNFDKECLEDRRDDDYRLDLELTYATYLVRALEVIDSVSLIYSAGARHG